MASTTRNVNPGAGERKKNPWLDHVKAYRESHPELSYKEVLQQAKDTYTKVEPTVKEPGEKRSNPWMEHIAEWKARHPDWKKTHTYKDVLLLCKETYKGEKLSPSGVDLV